VLASPASSRAQAGSPILRASDSFTVAGCSFNVAGVPQPCVSISWLGTATRVKHGGDFALTEASTGLCLGPTQAPQGTVLINSTQPSVSGI
jgi:hypothetical protein